MYVLTYLLTYCCLYGQAPRYLADHLTPASEVAYCLQFIVHRCRLCNYGRRAFSIAGPAIWNSLLDELIDLARSFDSFRQFLKFPFRLY